MKCGGGIISDYLRIILFHNSGFCGFSVGDQPWSMKNHRTSCVTLFVFNYGFSGIVVIIMNARLKVLVFMTCYMFVEELAILVLLLCYLMCENKLIHSPFQLASGQLGTSNIASLCILY